jgi:hypothetical protein
VETLDTLGIAAIFLVMLAAPCAIALRSSRRANEADASDLEEPLVPEMSSVLDDTLERPLTLAELAVRAESDALIAKELAREAHAAAMAATAYAARLRADAAVEAANAAEFANRAAHADYLPVNHPSLDFPRSRVRRRAA